MGYWAVSQNEVRGLLVQPHAHNIVLDSLLNYGVLGTACLSGFFYRLYARHFSAALKSKYKPIGLFVAAVAVSVFAHGITDVTIFYHQTGLLLLFLLSGLTAVKNEEEAVTATVTSKMQLGLAGLQDAVAIRTEVLFKNRDLPVNLMILILQHGMLFCMQEKS